MDRWGLEGMQSFEQVNVARKEGDRLEDIPDAKAANTDA